MKKYVKTEKIDGANHIRVDVYFEQANDYLSERRNLQKGIYLRITPTNYRTFTFNGVEYCEESFDCRLQGSIGLLKALTRKNSKLLAKYEEKFWDRAEDIARCFEDNDGNDLYTLITKINNEL